MKDSSKLLNFNVNRNLKFKEFRGVSFNLNRERGFNPNRDMFFDSNRDLGFGKRGVVFRGYVCPVCGAPVAKDASECDECNVQFQKVTTRKEKRSQKKNWSRGERHTKPPKKSASKKSPTRKSPPKSPASSPKAPSKKVAKQRRSTFQCPVCGKQLYVGTSKCPGCDVAFDIGQKAPVARTAPSKPPARAAAPGIVYCQKCNYKIPPADKFCRRCGSKRPHGTGSPTVSWQEFQAREKKDGIVSWDEYSNRG